MVDAVLLDLDDTLVVEEPAAVAAFEATALAASQEHPVDIPRLASGARTRARELWHAFPGHPYCRTIGISSWEGLWCRFEGDAPPLRALREWSGTYRREAWRLALADQGIEDVGLAERLGERFAAERRARHEAFPDAAPALRELRQRYALALVTNGTSCLQREKLAASGCADAFDVVLVSGEVGIAKPDGAIFRHALAELRTDASRAVMVGDSVPRDVDGALAAGLRAVWINRSGQPRPADRPELIEIASLSDLTSVLAELR
jgi:putative hydrolase of the HAD superfamily